MVALGAEMGVSIVPVISETNDPPTTNAASAFCATATVAAQAMAIRIKTRFIKLLYLLFSGFFKTGCVMDHFVISYVSHHADQWLPRPSLYACFSIPRSAAQYPRRREHCAVWNRSAGSLAAAR